MDKFPFILLLFFSYKILFLFFIVYEILYINFTSEVGLASFIVFLWWEKCDHFFWCFYSFLIGLVRVFSLFFLHVFSFFKCYYGRIGDFQHQLLGEVEILLFLLLLMLEGKVFLGVGFRVLNSDEFIFLYYFLNILVFF